MNDDRRPAPDPVFLNVAYSGTGASHFGIPGAEAPLCGRVAPALRGLYRVPPVPTALLATIGRLLAQKSDATDNTTMCPECIREAHREGTSTHGITLATIRTGARIRAEQAVRRVRRGDEASLAHGHGLLKELAARLAARIAGGEDGAREEYGRCAKQLEALIAEQNRQATAERLGAAR